MDIPLVQLILLLITPISKNLKKIKTFFKKGLAIFMELC